MEDAILGIEITSGRIYSSLKSLNKRGMLVKENKIVNGKVRIYYSITAEGEVYMQIPVDWCVHSRISGAPILK